MKTKPALGAAVSDLIDIALTYGESLTGLGATGAVNNTPSPRGQHRAGKEQVTAGAASMTVTFAGKNLAMDVSLSEMNLEKAP
jgi:hypothetical protein